MYASLETLARVLRREKRESEKQRQEQRKALAKAEERTAAAMKAAGAAEAAAAAAMASVAEASTEGGGGAGGAPRALMSVDEALDRAEALKKRANMVLTDTRYPEAVEQYTLGIKVRGAGARVCQSCAYIFVFNGNSRQVNMTGFWRQLLDAFFFRGFMMEIKGK